MVKPNVVEETNIEDEEMVYINLRLPMSMKLDLDNLYIKRIKENPKVRFTRSKVYVEVFEAGLNVLAKD